MLGIFSISLFLYGGPSADAVVSTLYGYILLFRLQRREKTEKRWKRSRSLTQIYIQYNIAPCKERRCYLSSYIIDTAACKGKIVFFLAPSLHATFSICKKEILRRGVCCSGSRERNEVTIILLLLISRACTARPAALSLCY